MSGPPSQSVNPILYSKLLKLPVPLLAHQASLDDTAALDSLVLVTGRCISSEDPFYDGLEFSFSVGIRPFMDGPAVSATVGNVVLPTTVSISRSLSALLHWVPCHGPRIACCLSPPSFLPSSLASPSISR